MKIEDLSAVSLVFTTFTHASLMQAHNRKLPYLLGITFTFYENPNHIHGMKIQDQSTASLVLNTFPHASMMQAHNPKIPYLLEITFTFFDAHIHIHSVRMPYIIISNITIKISQFLFVWKPLMRLCSAVHSSDI